MQLTAKAYRACDAVDECKRNAVACLAVLRWYGIAHITSARQAWWTNRDTFAVLLEDHETGEPVGGVRLQRWGNGETLPLECALEGVDGRASSWVSGFRARGVGELCGLWCSRKLRGLGLGARLTSMGIAMATQARTNTLLGVCDTRNVATNVRLGFRRDLTLATQGTFEYPRPGLVAHVLRIDGACDDLPACSWEARSAIGHYRDTPVGSETIASDQRQVVLTRDLRLMTNSDDIRQERVAL
jgi:hypothetical protein